MNDHAEKVHKARTAALRALAPKLYRVSVCDINMVEHLTMATDGYAAIEKVVAAKYGHLKLDPRGVAKVYRNEQNVDETQTYLRTRGFGLSHSTTIWASEAEVVS